MQRSAPRKGGIPLDQFWRDEVLPLESPPKHNFKGRAVAASQVCSISSSTFYLLPYLFIPVFIFSIFYVFIIF
jgi:hypothetical protein